MPSAQPTPPPQRRQTAAVLVLALVLRESVAMITLLASGPQAFFKHGLEMSWLAQSMLDGHGLASPFGVPTGPTAFIAPAYPLLVTLIFAVFGSGSALSAAVIMALNLAANLVTIWLIMRLARGLFGQTAALMAGLFWACSLPLLWMPTILWETSFSTAILLGMVVFAVEVPALRLRGWLSVGAACALAGLVNPAMLPTLLALVALTAYRSHMRWSGRGLRLALAMLALAVVFSPWPLRNARVFHAFIPLRTTVGFELWMGNRPGADGFLDESLFPAFNPAELAAYERVGEVAYTNGKQALAEAYIRREPLRFITLTATRTWRFWSGTGSREGSVIFALHALATTLAGFFGLYHVARRKGRGVALAFALPLLLFPLPYCITHAEFRYRLVVDPILTVLAAGAVTYALRPRRIPATAATEQHAIAA